MVEYRFSPKAQTDIDAIFDYTATRWDLTPALHYTGRIEEACAKLAKTPRQSQDCPAIAAGYRRLPVEQHVIYFRETSYGIAVIRILHQRMEVGLHL